MGTHIKKLTARIPVGLFQRFEVQRAGMGISQSALVEVAIRHLLRFFSDDSDEHDLEQDSCDCCWRPVGLAWLAGLPLGQFTQERSLRFCGDGLDVCNECDWHDEVDQWARYQAAQKTN